MSFCGLKEHFFILLLLLSLFLSFGLVINSSDVIGSTNQSVQTKVNVTAVNPEIYNVVITPSSVDLNPGSTTEVICNASVYDGNGWANIENATAILYDTRYGSNWLESETDNNYRYINASCPTCIRIGSSENNASCACSFPVQYYAYNGTWACNITVIDQSGLNDTENSSTSAATINTVVGIDVPALIDFGNMSVFETSSPVRENVTNFGNVDINISVRGWGGDGSGESANFSMVCSDYANSINISNVYERYDISNSTDFGAMYNITNESTMIPDITIPFRLNDTAYDNSTNATFWKLQIPVGVSGFCNGTVEFLATDASYP